MATEQDQVDQVTDPWVWERRTRQDGFMCIAGVDEAGRGPLAGPVVAAAVVLPEDFDPIGVKDSKALTAKRREVVYERLAKECTAFAVGVVGPSTIDRINILNATFMAAREALLRLSVRVDIALIDGKPMRDIPVPQKAIVGGDAKCISIAAASIVAKVTRDRLMTEYHDKFPNYGFCHHKGYCTREHLEAIERFGVCEIHRKTFYPVSEKVNAACRLPGLEED